MSKEEKWKYEEIKWTQEPMAEPETEQAPEDNPGFASKQLTTACLDLLEDWFPIAAVADPTYAATVCEQLRRLVRRVDDYLSDRAVADLRGQTPLPFESPDSSSDTSEKSGETMQPAPE